MVGFVNLGVKARPNLVVLKRTKMPAVLVEVGFINSKTDNQLFDENFSDIAQAIASGILDTLNQLNASAKPQRFHVQVNHQLFTNNKRMMFNLIQD
ncbi:N-acetylmuramoyl-L-alanine amidase [Dorea longicatena]|nr:N-acetylmuramoyl-L-alanine amidase [Dorea longicatena]